MEEVVVDGDVVSEMEWKKKIRGRRIFFLSLSVAVFFIFSELFEREIVFKSMNCMPCMLYL